MRILADKIREESYIAQSLSGLSFDTNFNKSQQVRKEQEYHWKKFNFMKNLNKAINKAKEG